jgi:Na+/proline symporter
LSPAYWIGNQAIVQRSLGAKSAFDAQASYVWGALLKNVIPVVIAVPGLIAIALIPELKDGDQAIPQLVTRILPTGLRGLFFAAFLAAMMSSVDSYLNAAASLVSYDFLKRFSRTEITDQQLLRVGRWTTVACVAWAILFASLLMRIREGSGIYAIFQTLMAFFQGPALAILLGGMLWRRATGQAAILGLTLGIGTSIGLYAFNQPAVASTLGWRPLFQIQEPFLYFSIWSFLVASTVLVLASWMTKPESEEKCRLNLWEFRGQVAQGKVAQGKVAQGKVAQGKVAQGKEKRC